MVIRASNVAAVATFEAEYYPVLLIDAHAVEIREITPPFLKAVRRGNLQVAHGDRGVKHIQLQLNSAPQFPRDPACGLRIQAMVNIFSGAIGERDNHGYTRIPCIYVE